MCQRIILLLSFLPMLLFSAEYEVPAGTGGNQIKLNIRNAGGTVLQGAKVVVKETPNWIHFTSLSVEVADIQPYSSENAALLFESDGGETGLTGQVVLQVLDQSDKLLAEKSYLFTKSLGEDIETQLSVYPNPANPSATIPFILTEQSEVRIEVFNMLGQRVRTLLDENRNAGKWETHWDGRNAQGSVVATGTYIIRIQMKSESGLKQNTTKILIQK